ncbi:MAG: efflux RND transporter periplasmic adaptor subunit [Marinilabiliales bacterium]|nr:MAG: efflux RND transporter periplasmic adaptor subunit [Marinilabiliales bacterium]
MTSRKKVRVLFYTVITIAVLGIIAYPKVRPLLAGNSNSPQGNPGQQRGPQALNVQGMVITPQHMSELINSTGTLLSDEEADLAFETAGRIVGIFFDEGTRVRKGDLMAKINDRPLQAQLQRLTAQKRLVEEREFRQRSLLERDAISQESYDQVATELQVIEADISLLEARIAETELRAPFDGIVGLRYLSEGSYVTPNIKIARLVKNQPIKIEFSVPERYSGQITEGFPINFRMDGIANTFNARVYAVEPKIDIRTRTISVRALYPNTNEELSPGRFAQINLQLSEINDAVAIPTEAVIPEMEGERVFVYRSGRAQSVNINTGLRTESHIQVIGGLEFGDTLLTTGVMQLRPGMPVDIYLFQENGN